MAVRLQRRQHRGRRLTGNAEEIEEVDVVEQMNGGRGAGEIERRFKIRIVRFQHGTIIAATERWRR